MRNKHKKNSKISNGVNKVYIIGMGPGTEDYMLPIAKREIEKADCLIGAKRLLSLFARLNKEKIQLEGHFKDVLAYIKENRDTKKIAVLVSGDPGLYSFLGQLSRVLTKEEYAIIPGISAVQIAFAKIGESREDAKIISLHGRKPQNLLKGLRHSDKSFLFLDSKFPPQKVARYLLDKGMKNRKAFVFENLSYQDERIIETDLRQLVTMQGFKMCVMVIK